jgi:hypothetical protein
MKNINKGKKKFLAPLIATLFLTSTILYLGERAESSIPSIPGIPSFLEKGDVLMLELPGGYLENWLKGGGGKYDMPPDGVINDHAALYMGSNFKPSSSEYCNQDDWDYYGNTAGVWFISALHPNVHYNTIDYFIDVPNYNDLITNRAWEFRYGHVVYNSGGDVSSTIKNGAIAWAVGKLGDEYQIVFEDGWIKHANYVPPQWLFPNSYKWYCMELTWAAYYNQGINIDSNGGLGVSGNDILADNNYENYPMWP